MKLKIPKYDPSFLLLRDVRISICPNLEVCHHELELNLPSNNWNDCLPGQEKLRSRSVDI